LVVVLLAKAATPPQRFCGIYLILASVIIDIFFIWLLMVV